ncbi:MAG: histidine--tRNA ligase [Bacillota bacterium]
MEIIKRPRGTADITPEESPRWRHLESVAREVCRRYGYGEIATPILERTELFRRTVGETTDIVEKEMYTFDDRGGRSLTLRPEGTAAAARLYLEEGLHAVAQPVKLSYVGWPIFRYERPQAGRLRQHHQFGVECFGSDDPAVDAEIICLACDFLSELGLEDLVVGLNNIGCPRCRGTYRTAVREHFAPHLERMCPDCRRRYQANPLRLLDCKVERCHQFQAGVPEVADFLCDDCRDHFARLQAHLDALGIDYRLDPGLVRGLDYYTRTVFEIEHRALDAQDVVCGGGRYDGLVEILGGEPTPGVGFGLGMERLLMILEREDLPVPGRPPADAFVVTIGEEAKVPALTLVRSLRRAGLSADLDYMGRSVRAQMRHAGRYPSRFVLVLGPDELQSGAVTIRDMEDGSQQTVGLGDIEDFLKGCGGGDLG